MEELKFRAWNPDQKIMIYSIDLGTFFDHTIYPYKDWIIQQCSFIKDENKVLIYKGDICDNDHMKYEVIFKNGAFRGMALDCKYNDSFNHTELYSIKGLKVIGNIFD